MRQIIITEELINDGPNTYYKDDKATFDDSKAQAWIDAGWAKDPITGEQGERTPGPVKVKPDNVKQKTK